MLVPDPKYPRLWSTHETIKALLTALEQMPPGAPVSYAEAYDYTLQRIVILSHENRRLRLQFTEEMTAQQAKERMREWRIGLEDRGFVSFMPPRLQ